VRLAEARKFALSLPETTEEPHFEAGSFRVRGKIFATVPPGGKQLRIFVEQAEAEALFAEDALTFEPVVWGKRTVPGAVCVNLATASAAQVRELLEDAWRMRAPKRAITALEAARGGSRRSRGTP
jgi:hypothetical protein